MTSPLDLPAHVEVPTSRREFLLRAGAGFGGLALASLLARDATAAEAPRKTLNPLAPKPPHFAARARSVIWCFLDGGPSHIDLFDPKPALQRLAGQPLPPSFERPQTAMGVTARRSSSRRSRSSSSAGCSSRLPS